VDEGDDGLCSEPIRQKVVGEGEEEGETTIRRGLRGGGWREETAPGEEGKEGGDSSRLEEGDGSGECPWRTMESGRAGRGRAMCRVEG
jgi:hypothetical protein